MKELLSLIILDYKKAALKCASKLETEESSKVLASTQGELSACKLFLGTFESDFSASSLYQDLDPKEAVMPRLDKATDKQIATLEAQRIELEKNFGWEEFLKLLEIEEGNKKEWLYYSAEKGRDLDFVHGWRDCLTKHSQLCNSIESEYEFRVEQNQLFPEDLEIGVAK